MVKPQILVIDDQMIARRVVKKILGPDYEYIEADSGEAALKLLTDGLKPFAILCDFHMPGLNGHEFLDRKKLLPDCGDIPCIIVSAAHSESLKEFSRMKGAVAWVNKPIRDEELIGAVRNLVAKA